MDDCSVEQGFCGSIVVGDVDLEEECTGIDEHSDDALS